MAPTAIRHATAEDNQSPAALEAMLAALEDARRATLELVGHLSDEQLERVLSPIMSPLVWDLAHIAAYEDLWIAHRHAGLDLLREDLAAVYDAFETPRSVRGEIELLDAAQARAYLDDVRAQTVVALTRAGVGDGVLCEMVVRHELQHQETMRQTMALAGLLPVGEQRRPHPPPGEQTTSPRGDSLTQPLEDVENWMKVPAGAFEMGADADGFAYDNERPRHSVQLAAFQIAHRPVSNASWMRFSEGGGYERREWWSDEGWAWKEEYDITHDPRVAAGHPAAPVCHVSWYEAEAYARAMGARLPSEAEWERAARLDGDVASAAANLRPDEMAGNMPATRGVLACVGAVWEWTSSAFAPYPGFVAHPYREYSEVFFGDDYRVLRGGSWATSERVGTVTFRNWDLPIRRQIFAGVRLARDAA
jgi:gamma-glutamyl hercynylcysteine S-oxide synthase